MKPSLLARVERLLDALERLLPPAPGALDWAQYPAAQWHGAGASPSLWPVERRAADRLQDLIGIEDQKAQLVANTEQFLAGWPANNALLTGARGMGKSSLVRALVNDYARHGLRLIEVDKEDLLHLPDIIRQLDGEPYRFILYCDDLSFEAQERGYKALKSVLEGSIYTAPDNVLVYATSNRRHLLPEYGQENLQAQRVGDEIHPGEAVEEKVSLSDRFGLWISFQPANQAAYLALVEHWVSVLGAQTGEATPWSEALERAALQWALARGHRSGRVAKQFARHWVGAQARERSPRPLTHGAGVS